MNNVLLAQIQYKSTKPITKVNIMSDNKQDAMYRWVKASERMPEKPGRYCVKRFGEPMVCDAYLRKNNVMVFVYPNRMTWPGYKDFEWLEPVTQSIPKVKL